MPKTIRLTVTPDLEKALQILRKSTLGTLNTTELIKMAVGSFAQMKAADKANKNITAEDWNRMSAQSFYEWAKEDGSLEVDNISSDVKLKPFIPDQYVPTG